MTPTTLASLPHHARVLARALWRIRTAQAFQLLTHLFLIAVLGTFPFLLQGCRAKIGNLGSKDVNAYTCECTCDGDLGPLHTEFNACVPANLDPNLNPSASPLDFDAANLDCQMRVLPTFANLANQCVAGEQCDCQAKPDSLLFDRTCLETVDIHDDGQRLPCQATQLDQFGLNCKEATHADGNDDPVCLVGNRPLGAAFQDIALCEVAGTVVAQLDDRSETTTAQGTEVERDSQLNVEVNLQGVLVNQPPLATVGEDQVVECAAGGATPITLVASVSDPDGNGDLAVTRWYRDNPTGPLVGTTPVVTLTQGVGTQTYVFQAVDTRMQTAPLESTTVRVVDTAPPRPRVGWDST